MTRLENRHRIFGFRLRLIPILVLLILPPAPQLSLLDQPLVLVGQQVRVDLADGVHDDHDDDQTLNGSREARARIRLSCWSPTISFLTRSLTIFLAVPGRGGS